MIDIMNQLARFPPVGRVGRGLRQAVGADGPDPVGHEIGHWRAQIDLEAVGQMLDVKNANVEIQEKMRACRGNSASQETER
jgi:hypothetical protein